MNRRHFLSMLGAAPTLAAMGGQGASAQGLLNSEDLAQQAAAVWQAWKGAYLQPSGRVVDGLQQNASHSEGQGYGAVLAVEFADQEALTRILDWTEANLALRGDSLLAWRYLPDASNPVPDLNNASDGDLFYAWALVRAAARHSGRSELRGQRLLGLRAVPRRRSADGGPAGGVRRGGHLHRGCGRSPGRQGDLGAEHHRRLTRTCHVRAGPLVERA